MGALQVWLVTTINEHSPVVTMMQSPWVWPTVESLHFLGLCLLIGAIGSFDLRLLGIGRAIPIAAAHRLIPVGILGFLLNVSTGALFVMTEPDQYIYNPSFHLKLMFIVIAGLNAGAFYLTSFRVAFGSTAAIDAPVRARIIAAISLSAWVAVIVCGRLITFYRPAPCSPAEMARAILTCFP